MDHPPYVNVALHSVLIAREPVDALGHQHGQFFPGGHPDALCMYTHSVIHPVVARVLVPIPMNSFHDSFFLQPSGHEMTTVLCFMPPSPAL